MIERASRRLPVRAGYVLAPLLLAAVALTACTTGGSGSPGSTVTVTHSVTPTASAPTTSATTTAPTSTAPSTSAATGAPVHIKTLNSDGQTYGVGMPIIAYFSRRITSSNTLIADTTVTANGQPVVGSWYFEYSDAQQGYPIEGHWRPEHYWPANAQIHVDLPMKGKSAGPGLVYDDSLTLDFAIGAKHVLWVRNRTHTLTVYNNDKKWGSFPVSLGAKNTPTLRGTKVIMEKGLDISMRGPGYYDPHVKYTQRLTYGGEYLHSAPWNIYNIEHGINSSNGCTNLRPADAKKLYNFLRIGDVVRYPDANGPTMQLGQGYGDWNLTWAQWRTGGLVPTTA